MKKWICALGLSICAQLYAQPQPASPGREITHSFSVGLKAVSTKATGNIFRDEAVTGYGLHISLLPEVSHADAYPVGFGLSLDLVSWDGRTSADTSVLFDPDAKLKVRLSNLYWDVCSTRGLLVCVGLPLSNTAVLKQSTGDSDTELTLAASSFPARLLLIHRWTHWQVGLESAVASWSVRVQGVRAFTQTWSHAFLVAYSL